MSLLALCASACFGFLLMQVCDQHGTVLVSNFSYLLKKRISMNELEDKVSRRCSWAAFSG